MAKLMLAVMASLDIHPGMFESVLDVFREEHVYSEFCRLFMDSYYGELAIFEVRPKDQVAYTV